VLLRPDKAPPQLTWPQRKAELLGRLGVDAVVLYPTDRALLKLEPQEFFQQIVQEQLRAQSLVEGPNFFFGRDRRGNVEVLAELARAQKIGFEVVSPHKADGQVVSSSTIRGFVASGDVQSAGEMLGRPHRVRGRVVVGAQRGATIGFPTANLEETDTMLPAAGVYAATVPLGEQMWAAAVNLGPNPTFAEQARKLEVHLLDFSGDLYGQILEVDFLARLRDIQQFAGVPQLKQQLEIDVAAARRIAAERAGHG
jgi:riboflavin kinase/FMN adenylyltransferase